MLLTACTTTETVYVDRVVMPPLTFPEFPKLENEVRNEDGSVTVSGAWIIRLAEYKIKIKATEKSYQDVVRILEGDQEKGAEDGDNGRRRED